MTIEMGNIYFFRGGKTGEGDNGAGKINNKNIDVLLVFYEEISENNKTIIFRIVK